jgi:hypothetical protein
MRPDRVRRAELEFVLAAVAKKRDLHIGAITYLLDAVKETVEFQLYVGGGEDVPDVKGMLDAVVNTDVGEMVFAERDEAPAKLDPATATEGMTPQQKINWARANGLA